MRIVMLSNPRASRSTRWAVPRLAVPSWTASTRFSSTTSMWSSHHAASSASVGNLGTMSFFIIVHVQRIVPDGLLRFARLNGMTGDVLGIGPVPIEPDIVIRHLLLVYG